MRKPLLFFLSLLLFSLTISSYSQNRDFKKTAKERAEEIKKSSRTKSTKDADEKRTVIMEAPVLTTVALTSPKNIKLKVTLLEIQSSTTQNGSIAHLSINQHVRYESKGKVIKPISKDVQRKMKFSECGLGDLQLEGFGIQAPRLNNEWEGATPLICGDRNNQIHVTQSKRPLTRNPNINHSVVFAITQDQANDKNAEFLIDTFVAEYSKDWKGKDTSIALNHDSRRINVAIHDVLAILQGNKKLNETTKYLKDSDVSSELLFDHFDGLSIPLRNVNKNGKMILEGPIRARNKGSELIEKAFVWMRFELID